MIIAVDSDIKSIQQLDIVVNRATVADDPPPAYTTDSKAPSKTPPASGFGVEPLPPQAQPLTVPNTVKPTNFLSLSRGNQSIKGIYVIDPRIKIPQSLLPPLAADETESTRRNVFLHTSNGSIDVALFVVGDGDHKQKVNMLLKSSNGYIVAKLHTAASAARPPVKLRVQSSNGSVTIHVPRSFRGPVTLRTSNGSTRLSDAVAAALTTFTEAKGTRRCFIGDFSDWTDMDAGSGWAGDELEVEASNGAIRLLYEDGGGKGNEGKGNIRKAVGV
ncbi:hypothetical protein C8R46DRAFT_1186849 [Mycena filopes]|nr:hypothetical protein C8R46DRAFT_1186849 [Mycena filopes]